jgi:hypothetical protein
MSVVAEYTTKMNVQSAMVFSDKLASPAPVSAIFFLDPPRGTDDIRISEIGGARVCIALVENSFSLDPTDLGRANERMTAAASLAAFAPAYSLSYPRHFSILGEVCEKVAEQAAKAALVNSGVSQ